MITINGATGEILHNGISINSGNVIQVQKVKVSSTSQITANSTFNDTGLTLNFTPKFSNSTTRITVNMRWGNDSSSSNGLKLLRDSTAVYENNDALHNVAYNINTNRPVEDAMYTFFDTPGTTSQVTYKLQIRVTNGQFSFNGRGGELNSPMDSYMIVEEIAA